MAYNGRTRTTTRKIDAWAVYDALPGPIKAALQEGPQQWDAVWIRSFYRRQQKVLGPKSAVASVVELIMGAHAREIRHALPWQPRRGVSKDKRVPSPHLLAQATMQLSGRPL